MTTIRPIFCVSDLHMGDGGPRDNFAHMSGGRREQEFISFLDYVESQDGKLYIVGDLFELWQGNVSQVLTCRVGLLDRLAMMGAMYLLGNHDIDLRYFDSRNGVSLAHPLLRNLKLEWTIEVNGKRVLMIHGHEQDKYCRSDVPGLGRISAIYSGLREDRNGSPLYGKYGEQTVEARSLSRWDRLSNFARRCVGEPNHSQIMRQAILGTYVKSKCSALIYGHTHEPGQFYQYTTAFGMHLPVRVFNCGTWAEQVNSFVRIDPSGEITVMDWVGGKPRRNHTRLDVGECTDD